MSYSKSRDMRIADETLDDAKDRQALMCAATGCPNRWSIDQGNGRLCSWHDRAPASQWPAVTQEQLDAEGDRARSRYLPAQPLCLALTSWPCLQSWQRWRSACAPPCRAGNGPMTCESRSAQGSGWIRRSVT